jgi:hypothetical protein
MRMHGLRGAAALAALLAFAGCSKKTDTNAPLAFVPADTPFVYANIEPMPDSAVTQWRAQMEQMWPLMVTMMDQALAEIAKKDEGAKSTRVLRAVFDEVRERSTPEQWQQVGFSPKAHVALYGVDLLPVLRLELVDPDAFRAMFARIEQKAGESLGTARIGEQEVRTFGDADVQGLMAIEDHHLVVTLVPGSADEAMKRRVLGLDRPKQNLADSGALAEFNKTHGYQPIGSGWVDTRRVVALAAEMAAKDKSDAAKTFDATCREEFDALAAKAPRLTLGYREFSAERMTMHARLELDPALAKSLSALASPMPGTPSPDALLDFAMALPVLQGRDFLVAQYDAIAKSPFRCSMLVSMNQSAAESKTKLDQTIPPPVSDLTGARMTITRFAWASDAAPTAPPEVSGTLLIGSNNPSFLSSLAQMSVPALRDLKLAADGKPVAIPPGALPGEMGGKLDLSVAMTAKTLGISLGKDEAPKLAAAVAAVPAPSGTLFDMSVRGAFYSTFADAMGRFSAMLPEESRKQMEMQRQLYTMYAKWFKRVDATIAVVPEGLDFTETVELPAH